MKARNAAILWNPKDWEHGPAGEVAVVEHGKRLRKDLQFSTGAVWSYWDDLPADKLLAMVFIEFHALVVAFGLDPQVVHKAFLNIDEYREHISPDLKCATEASHPL